MTLPCNWIIERQTDRYADRMCNEVKFKQKSKERAFLISLSSLPNGERKVAPHTHRVCDSGE